MGKRKRKTERLLTEVELEMMGILWRLGEGTVHDVMRELPSERRLAYTSVSTMLRILEQKEFLQSRKAGRGNVYVPKVRKEDYEERSVDHLVEKVFEGEPTALVKRLIDLKGLSEADLREIRKLLDGRLR